MAHTITATDHLHAIFEDGFSYSYVTGFHYEGIKRLPGPELRRIFAPEEKEEDILVRVKGMKRRALIENLMEKNVTMNGKETVDDLRELMIEEEKSRNELRSKMMQKTTKKDLSGQLKLYGIEFKSSLSIPKLRELLAESVHLGKCDDPSEHMKELETNLKMLYQKLDKIHIETIARQRQEQFDAQYPTTAIAAIVNPKMFISRHFLALDGTPDPTKAPKPIVVHGLTHTLTWQIEEAVLILFRGQHYTSGHYLYTREDGPTDSTKVLAIGWDRSAVWDEARKAAKPLFARQAAEDERQKEERLGWHRDFVSELSEDMIVCNMKNIQGRYLITCEEIESEWPDAVRNCFGMRLGIMPEVGNPRRNLVADFHFAMLAGLMRLRPAGMKPSLGRTEKEIEEDKTEVERAMQLTKQGDHEKTHDEDDERDTSATSSTLKKRKAPAIRSMSSKKWRANSDPDRQDPSKFRLAFEYRGRETGEGEIECGSGWIEWDKNDSTKFEGRIDIGFIGTSVPFYGFKTELLTKGMRQVSEWSDYSDDPYEMGRTLR